MEVRVFTLCDGAYNYNGKLTIVGTVDHIKLPKVPVVATIGVAAKIVFDNTEAGEKRVSLSFVDDSDSPIIPPIEFTTRVDSDGFGNFVLAGNINGLDIKKYGNYKVVLRIDDYTMDLPFKVVG